ncbi:PQ loop repeat-domain-containing protein [Linnemannia elongata]|nr:PQ loop repeat-domain-containing protein [Linnemannia elongata]
MDTPPPQCIGWIETIFGECVTNQRHAWSLMLGYTSIFCWLNAQIPQIIENFKLSSAASLSLPFLINWLLGDISNLIGCILTKQLPFQLYLAIYFCIADIILFTQWIYYSHQEKRRKSLPDIVVADLPEITETEHHHHRHHHTRSHHRPSNNQRSSVYSQRSRRGTINTTEGIPAMGQGEDLEVNREDDMEGLDANETVSPLLPRPRPRRATTASDIAHRRSTSMVLFGLVLFTMRQTMPGLEQSGAGILSYNSGAANTYSGRVFSKRGLDDSDPTMGEEPAPTDPNIVQLGRIFAWVCTVFYLSSRMPQLWKNFTRKSVQGLSILMFFWAAMGNLSYTLSILNSKDAINPETRHKFLLEAVPYVLGSSGTLMFDLSIFCQWLYYTGKLRVLGLRPKRYHHHHHRRHHSRSTVGRGSRTQSGLNSMVLSPSGSQSGLYNILVDEEDPDVIESSNALTPQIGSGGGGGLSPFQEEVGPLDHEPQKHQNQQGHGSDIRSPLL